MVRGADHKQAAAVGVDFTMNAPSFSSTVITRLHGKLIHTQVPFQKKEFLDTRVLVAWIVRTGGHAH